MVRLPDPGRFAAGPAVRAPAPLRYNAAAERGGAEASLATSGFAQAREGKGEAAMERLVFHGAFPA